MNDLTHFIEQIQQLSPANQAKLADYIAFLRWQETEGAATARAASDWSFSFIEAFKEAAVYASQEPAGMDVKMAPATVGGQSRPALWAHPPLVGQAVIEYHVPIPQQIKGVQLRLAIGIRDGAKIAPDNLVAFGVRVNGLRVWEQQTNAQSWQEVQAPLNLLTGDMARIEFTTETLGSHQWTWAVWGEPEIIGKVAKF